MLFFVYGCQLINRFQHVVIRYKTIVQHQNGPCTSTYFLSMAAFLDIRLCGVKCDDQESDHEVEEKNWRYGAKQFPKLVATVLILRDVGTH